MVKLWLLFINCDSTTQRSQRCVTSDVITFVVAAVVGGGLMFASKTYYEDDTQDVTFSLFNTEQIVLDDLLISSNSGNMPQNDFMA